MSVYDRRPIVPTPASQCLRLACVRTPRAAQPTTALEHQDYMMVRGTSQGLHVTVHWLIVRHEHPADGDLDFTEVGQDAEQPVLPVVVDVTEVLVLRPAPTAYSAKMLDGAVCARTLGLSAHYLVNGPVKSMREEFHRSRFIEYRQVKSRAERNHVLAERHSWYLADQAK